MCKAVKRPEIIETPNVISPKRLYKSEFKGVSYHGTKNLWFARLCLKGYVKNLGYFKTELEAAEAYAIAAEAKKNENEESCPRCKQKIINHDDDFLL